MTGPKRTRNRNYTSYSGYWREAAIECAHCRLLRPVSWFGKCKGRRLGLDSYCRRCKSAIAVANWKKNRPAKIAAQKDSYWGSDNGETSRRKARERYAQNRERERAKSRDKLKRNRSKTYAYMQGYLRQRWPRLMLMARYLRMEYKVDVTKEELRKVWFERKAYGAAMMLWKKKKYAHRYAPVFYCPDPKKFNVKKLEIMPKYLKLRILGKANFDKRVRSKPEVWATFKSQWKRKGAKESSGTPIGDVKLSHAQDVISNDHLANSIKTEVGLEGISTAV